MSITYRGIGFDGGDFDAGLYPWAVGSRESAGSYNSTDGHGFLSTAGQSNGNGTLPDSRLFGGDTWSGGSIVYRFDLPNGTYTVRCAVGSVSATNQAGLSIDNDDGSTIDLDSGAPIDKNSILCADNTVIADTDWVSSNSGLGGGPGVSFTITKGYALFHEGVSSAGRPRWIQFESAEVVLQDATVNTDHTGFTASATSGVTTAGSPVVTGLSSTSGWKTGMRLDASSVPAGTLIRSVDSSSQVTLTSESGITAATGLAVDVGYPVMLYEKSPAGALIAPLTLVTGAATDLVVYEDDGTTVNPYIELVAGDTAPWLRYLGTPLPGPTPYAFKVAQTDGSTHVTSFSLPVIAAPDKLIDAETRPVLAKMLTPNYLRRKNTLDTIASGKWPGYKGQSFAASATVYSLAQMLDQMDTYQASAGTNKWFHIMLGTGSGSDDWATDLNSGGSQFDFKPSLGGGLLITNAVGQQPVIKGFIYTGAVCGMQFGLLGVYAGINNAPIISAPEGQGNPQGTWRADGANIDAANTMIFENVWSGSQADPANAGDTMLDIHNKASVGFNFSYVGDQITVRNCRFLGNTVGVVGIACHKLEVLDNEFAVLDDDCVRIGACAAPLGRWGTSGPLDGTGGDDVFIHIARNTQHRQIDYADSIGWTGANWNDPHWDVVQVQTQVFFADATGCSTMAGSAVVTGIVATSGVTGQPDFAPGMVFDCPTVPLGTLISSVDSMTQITLATGTGVTAGSDLPASARTYTGAIHIVNEDWTVVNKVTTISVNPDDSSKVGFPVRQFFEPSDPCPIYASINNNMTANSAKAGLAFGNGVGFAEFNSIGGSAELPASTEDAAVTSIQQIFSRDDELKGAPNCNYSRLNISLISPPTNGLGASLFTEGDVIADFSGGDVSGTLPGDVMAGTFTQDGDRTGRWGFSIDDTLEADPLRKVLYDTFKPKMGVQAGVQELHLRLNTGDVATLTTDQATSLSAIVNDEPTGSGLPGVSVFWHRGASETGPTDGIEVTYDVIGD